MLALQPLKTIRAYCSLPFNLGINQSYLASCFLTSNYLISWLSVSSYHIRHSVFLPLRPLNGKQQFATTFLTPKQFKVTLLVAFFPFLFYLVACSVLNQLIVACLWQFNFKIQQPCLG